MHGIRRTGRTRRAVSRALTYLTLIPVFALLLVTSAYAGVTTVGGGAVGESVHVTTAPDAIVNSGPLPAVTLPPGGTTNLASVNVPGIVQTGLLTVSSDGHTGSFPASAHSKTSVTDVLVGPESAPTITARVLTSECNSNEYGSAGSAGVGGIEILGVLATVPAKNTTINIPGVGSAIIAEEISDGTAPATASITVNALHLHLNGSLGTGDIIIAQSRCAITGTAAPVPTGAIGGVLLTGLVAVVFAGYQVGRSRTRRRDLTSALASQPRAPQLRSVGPSKVSADIRNAQQNLPPNGLKRPWHLTNCTGVVTE